MLEFDEVKDKLINIIRNDLPVNMIGRIGEESSNTFKNSGGRPVADYITNRSMALYRALRGDGSKDEKIVQGDEIVYKRTIELVYANLLHNGGSTPITKRSQVIAAIMRMKAMGYYTKQKPYTATKGQFTYKPRPFINMGIEKVAPRKRYTIF